MNWLDFIKVNDFKNYLTLLCKQTKSYEVINTSVNKQNYKNFGDCFVCDIILDIDNEEWIETMIFGEYGIIKEDAEHNEIYDYFSDDTKLFLKFMILALEDKKINNLDYEASYLRKFRTDLMQEMNKSISYIKKTYKERLQSDLTKFKFHYSSIVIKALYLDINQTNIRNFDNKKWIDFIDINKFRDTALHLILPEILTEPNEVIELRKEDHKIFGPCIVIKTVKDNDYYGKNGYIYGKSSILNSYHRDYIFTEFGLLDINENKYETKNFFANKIFYDFMINEVSTKRINNKTYANELIIFIKEQKELIKQEGLLKIKKAINKEKEQYYRDLMLGSEIIKDLFKEIKDSIKKINEDELQY